MKLFFVFVWICSACVGLGAGISRSRIVTVRSTEPRYTNGSLDFLKPFALALLALNPSGSWNMCQDHFSSPLLDRCLLSSNRWQFARHQSQRSSTSRESAARMMEETDDGGMPLGSFELELFSPARINLFLRILGRCDDGFHESASVFQAIELGDDLRLARIPASPVTTSGVVRPSRKSEAIKQNVEFTISPADLDIPTDQTNSVVRALTLFRNKLTARDGGSLEVPRFRAHLVKNVPNDAGLGGAASNAATALFGANELCGRPASAAELMEWAAEIGSDVVSFLAGSGSAYCTGRGVFVRGERVEALPPIPEPLDGSLFVIAPERLTLSTPAMFRDISASQYAGLSTADPLELRNSLSVASGAKSMNLVNDLEPAARRISVELTKLHAVLRKESDLAAVHMSGAGSALFAFGKPSEGASVFAARLAEECTAACGVRTNVWSTIFARKEGGGWYSKPAV